MALRRRVLFALFFSVLLLYATWIFYFELLDSRKAIAAKPDPQIHEIVDKLSTEEPALSKTITHEEKSHAKKLFASIPVPNIAKITKSHTPVKKVAINQAPKPTPSDHKVSAIILNWKRPNNLKLVLARMLLHPFIGEIIVWNNNNQMHVQASLFDDVIREHLRSKQLPNNGENVQRFRDSFIRIINSPNNLHDFAKHLSCSMATYESCYFQDDDWDNHFLKTSFALHRKYPNLIISNTMAVIHLEHRRWMMTDPQIGLHTGFTWLGCGSFISKSKSVRFVKQLTSVREITNEDLLLADMFFSIWTNEYPYQLENDLFPLNQTGAWSAREDQWDIVYGNVHKASTILAKYLQDREQTLFSTSPIYPPLDQRTARAPCHTDECLFTTNMGSFPNPDMVVFDPKITIREQEPKFNRLNFPDSRFWVSDAYHFAVDGKSDTCWRSWNPIIEGSWFGVDLLEPYEVLTVSLVLKRDEKRFIDHFTLLGSLDEKTWTEIGYSALLTDDQNLEFQLSDSKLLRYIRFEVRSPLSEQHFVVCEINYTHKPKH